MFLLLLLCVCAMNGKKTSFTWMLWIRFRRPYSVYGSLNVFLNFHHWEILIMGPFAFHNKFFIVILIQWNFILAMWSLQIFAHETKACMCKHLQQSGKQKKNKKNEDPAKWISIKFELQVNIVSEIPAWLGAIFTLNLVQAWLMHWCMGMLMLILWSW